VYKGQAESCAVVEALAGSDAVARAGAAVRAIAPRAVVTCARGSSDHAATFAKYLLATRTGIPTASAAPSIASVYETRARAEDCLCLTISQSGRSPDLLATVESLKLGGARVLALVNDASSPLAQLADEVLPLGAGVETSVAATKSYIASLFAVAAVVAEWTDDAAMRSELGRTSELLREAWQADWSALAEALTNASSMYVIGRGLGLGIAQEAALKLKETSQIHAEALSGAELHHGPMALVKAGFPILVFTQDDETAAGTDKLCAELAERGAAVFAVGRNVAGTTGLPMPDAPALLQPMLQIQGFYRAANALALARGLDPDRPPHLAKVTETI
jgi:glucosamine--fructose-6-phosphate aminotransferase (isomerizing)